MRIIDRKFPIQPSWRIIDKLTEKPIPGSRCSKIKILFSLSFSIPKRKKRK